jgi:serine/threonine protein kinase
VPALTELDRYRYIAALGTGGMATVSLAEDTVLGRKVALKRVAAAGLDRGGTLLHRDRTRNEVTRLRREALLGASVSHPNIVWVYDVVTTDEGDVVIVMEYVHGETLRDRMIRDGRMAPEVALSILQGVAAGLDFIHQRGIVHRDVKPANVLLGADGAVKLADLGVATVPDRTRITSAGAVVGTFRYMAPEQLGDGPSRPAVDIYALAVVAFEMLSGQRARPESHPMALVNAIANQPPPDLRDVWTAAPSAAAELLMQAMDRDPVRRPGSASELVKRLSAALLPEPTERIPIVPASPPVQAERPVPLSFSVPAAAPAPAPMPVSAGRRERTRHQASREQPPRRRRFAVLLSVLGLLAAAAVSVGIVLADSSTPSPTGARRAAHHAAAAHKRGRRYGGSSAAKAGTASTPATGSTAGTLPPTVGSIAGASAAAGNPISAVESFYHLAAAHSYSQAWALADPTFQSQLGGYSSFVAGQSGDRSITFDSARVLTQTASAARVGVTTTSVRTNGTQHCGGTVELVLDGSNGTWLLHLIHINCT